MTILLPSYLHNVISYTNKTSLYWIQAQVLTALLNPDTHSGNIEKFSKDLWKTCNSKDYPLIKHFFWTQLNEMSNITPDMSNIPDGCVRSFDDRWALGDWLNLSMRSLDRSHAEIQGFKGHSIMSCMIRVRISKCLMRFMFLQSKLHAKIMDHNF